MAMCNLSFPYLIYKSKVKDHIKYSKQKSFTWGKYPLSNSNIASIPGVPTLPSTKAVQRRRMGKQRHLISLCGMPCHAWSREFSISMTGKNRGCCLWISRSILSHNCSNGFMLGDMDGQESNDILLCDSTLT